jgi:hypothetical protein
VRRGFAPLALLLLSVLAIGACAEGVSSDAPTAAPTRLPVFATAPPATAEATTVAPLTSTEVQSILEELICWYDDPALAADCLPVGPEVAELLGQIAESGDERFVAPLVDMLWLELGWERWVQEALTALTGQSFLDGYGWSTWLATERPTLPDGYLEWKGRLLSLVDEQFTELLNDDQRLAVRGDELIWSRVAVDEQEPLVDPETVHRVEERYLGNDDVVFGVFINGEARAYPLRILGWHELVSDELGGRPLIVADCVPCGGTVVYGATSNDGVRHDLGNSGLVYHSRRLLYDRDSFSLWDSLTGRAIGGDALTSGAALTPVPVLRTTWGDWAARHPNTTVLSLNTGTVRDYDEGAALVEDQAAEGPLFPAPVPTDTTVPAKGRVLGLTIEGDTRAYPVSRIEAAGIVHDTLGGQPIVLVSRGPGLGVSVYNEYDITFSYIQGSPDRLELVDTVGDRWYMDEEALTNVIDSSLRRSLPVRLAYWFAWADAYPDTSLWDS